MVQSFLGHLRAKLFACQQGIRSGDQILPLVALRPLEIDELKGVAGFKPGVVADEGAKDDGNTTLTTESDHEGEIVSQVLTCLLSTLVVRTDYAGAGHQAEERIGLVK